MTNNTLDIILPCYNPASHWEENVITAIQEIKSLLPEISIGLIIINDGSNPNLNVESILKIKNNISQFYYIDNKVNKGKGFVLRTGMQHSEATYCIYTDIDFPYTVNSFISIWNQLKNADVDIVAGVKDKNYYKHVPAARRMISKILRLFSGYVLRLKISDTQCGLKGVNAKGKQVFLTTTINRYLFDLEFIFLASKNKTVKLLPVEIQLRDSVEFSSMPFRILVREGFNFLKIFFKKY